MDPYIRAIQLGGYLFLFFIGLFVGMLIESYLEIQKKEELLNQWKKQIETITTGGHLYDDNWKHLKECPCSGYFQ